MYLWDGLQVITMNYKTYYPSGCSVIVCCHNSAERLPRTLRHIANQDVEDGLPWEVILVDNGSEDGTADLGIRLWNELKSPVELHSVKENQLGLSFARRAGVLKAKYDTIIFCDDDNWLDSCYISRSVRLLQTYPEVGIVGGQSMPVFGGSDLPEWFFTYAGSYAVGVQSLRSGDITDRGYVWGAGMALRSSLLRHMYQHGAESLLSGRKGSKLSAGDDSEICAWYRMAGFRLWFDELLKFSHYIPSERQSIEYVEKVNLGFQESRIVLKAYDTLLACTCLRFPPFRNAMVFARTRWHAFKIPRKLRSEIRAIERLVAIYCAEFMI